MTDAEQEMNYLISKCKTCRYYDGKTDKPKNKLRCTFGCEEYIRDSAQRALAYNRAVSGDNFDCEEIYEHGKRVYGSGGDAE